MGIDRDIEVRGKGSELMVLRTYLFTVREPSRNRARIESV